MYVETVPDDTRILKTARVHTSRLDAPQPLFAILEFAIRHSPFTTHHYFRICHQVEEKNK